MANELVIHYPTGATLYAMLFDATGQVYNGSTFGAPGSAAWTDYDIAMTEAATATGVYRASMPAVAAGVYGWVVRKRAGASPAVSDITVGAGSIRWTGTAEEAVPAAVNVTLWAGAAVADPPLSAQETADALLLAPAGAAADGSAMDYLADIAAANLSGSGALSYPVTVNDESSNPIDGVEVWISTDSAGASVVAGTLHTSALGVATFMLDAGTYYLWRQRSGYNFVNPVTIVVS